MKYYFALVLFWIGDKISIPMCKWDWAFLYPIYNKLMIWSSDLDKEGRIWKNGN